MIPKTKSVYKNPNFNQSFDFYTSSNFKEQKNLDFQKEEKGKGICCTDDSRRCLIF